jgi:hypothetical protein
MTKTLKKNTATQRKENKTAAFTSVRYEFIKDGTGESFAYIDLTPDQAVRIEPSMKNSGGGNRGPPMIDRFG